MALWQNASAQTGPTNETRGWLDENKPADERADLLAARLPKTEKIALIQGEDFGATAGKLANFTAYRLPPLLEGDAPQGITNLTRREAGTVMPVEIATAAT